jgi:HTH-type transcriptional regulator, sugar sensing transcriptional regulator
MEKILREIGLTQSEIKVYLALLDLGDSTRSGIVKKSEISGSKVYDILDKLKEKGLISIYDKNRVRHFKPITPKQILNYIDEKKEEINKLEQDAKSILPSLLLKFNASSTKQEVELLSGLKGLEIIFKEQVEILNKGETCYVIGGTNGIREEPVVAFFQKVHLLRENKKIKTKMLYNLLQKKLTEKFYSSKKYPNTETRYIKHTSPVAINVYSDRTVIIIFSEAITAIHIKSEDVAKSFKEYFDLLWKQAK